MNIINQKIGVSASVLVDARTIVENGIDGTNREQLALFYEEISIQVAAAGLSSSNPEVRKRIIENATSKFPVGVALADQVNSFATQLRSQGLKTSQNRTL